MMQDIAPSRPADAESFRKAGLLGPCPLFTREECRKIAAHTLRDDLPEPADWWKGRAVSDPFYHALATDERILSRLRPLLGDDIVLWGVDVLKRKPGQVHPWHCDIESCAPEGGFASVWIGIENTSKDSALICLAGSHLYGKTIQEVAAGHGLKRGQSTPEMVFDWAKERDPNVARIQPDMHDGDAIIFDGRIWHGTHNTRSEGERVALLIQYAAARRPVHMIDPDYLEWPFRFRTDLRPPVIVVSGDADCNINRVVAPPPPSKDGTVIDSFGTSYSLPLQNPADELWKRFEQFRGSTRSLASQGCHLSLLGPGHTPHPLHNHEEEEVIIMIDGEAEIFVSDVEGDEAPDVYPFAVGQFAYYPAWKYHTIHNKSDRPITYLMFKWIGPNHRTGEQMGASVFDFRPQLNVPDDRSFAPRLLFEHPTLYLDKLHCHLTRLAPGAGYEAHVDSYDVAHVVFSGVIRSMDHHGERGSMLYFSSGIPHDMENVGREQATYLVFEFHAA
ncbi:MAG: cupin domain-containing protein [Rhizobiales bacterium]|nr:cupin domain-containing protein [Hyphomicrobiales bacterium]